LAANTSFSEGDAFSARFLIKPIFFLRFRRRRNSLSRSLPIDFPECGFVLCTAGILVQLGVRFNIAQEDPAPPAIPNQLGLAGI
jgi:hypothetical protein